MDATGTYSGSHVARPTARPLSPHADTSLAAPVDGDGRTSESTPGSADELRRFSALQSRLAPMYRRVFSDDAAPRTVVVVPSMTLDARELEKLAGASHYEERMLCLLLLLRLRATRVVYLTSLPVPRSVVAYYLGLLPPEARRDARARLTMPSCGDGSAQPLTRKLLDRPALLEHVREIVGDTESAHITCFNATPLERTLAVRLDLPLYACDPALGDLGTKSGSRELFRDAGVAHPAGFERLRGAEDMASALAALRRSDPSLRRAVVKLEEGFSGEGNAIFAFDGAPEDAALGRWVRERLPRTLRYVAPRETWESFAAKFEEMGGIVEAMVDGCEKRSPSAQCRIAPDGRTEVISTHDQLLGGTSGQVYLGCAFPARREGRAQMHEAARRIAQALAARGAVGRFGIDFVVARDARDPDRWRCDAIEINLRKGGTTHPWVALHELTGGAYDTSTGQYRAASGRACCYEASDNISDPSFAGLDAAELIDRVRLAGLEYDRASERGVVLHLLGALREHGKVGATAIARTHADAHALLAGVQRVLHGMAARAGMRVPARTSTAPPRRFVEAAVG